MSGDMVLACSCGAELLIIASRDSASRLREMWTVAHSGNGHEATWPRSCKFLTHSNDFKDVKRVVYSL